MMGSPNRSSSWLNWAQAPREQGGLGLAPHQAAGIVGNLVHESGQDLNPWGPTGDNGTAWGTAQWRGDRLARLKARPDYQTVEGQQAFMREELDGPENKAYRALQAATTPEEAAHAWDAQYERSDGSTREQRMRSARDLMSQFGGDTTYTPGALTSSYTAPTESKKSMPAALSADNTMGQGVLASDYAGADPIAQGLIGIGGSLASISNPDQAKALFASQAALQKQAIDKGTWTMHVLPNGQVVRINSKTGIPQTLGNAAKPEEDTYTKKAQEKSAESNQALGDQINQNARDAAGLGSTVTEIRAALSDPGLKTGIDGPARQFLNKAYTSLGFGDAATASAAANGDIASALSNKLALQLVNAGGVKLLPGSFSDSDRTFVQQMATSLKNTPEANARLLDIYERANKNTQEAEALRAQHVNDNGGIIKPSFREELANLSAKQLKAAQEEAAARTKAAAPAAAPAKQPSTFKTKSGISWSY
jgi:hypothetical protein